MKHIAFATSLICFLSTYHEVNAQGFWYVPPGADLSYRYGIDLGNGLGFGYGFGVGYGSPANPDFALGGATNDLVRLQSQSNSMMRNAFNGVDLDAGSTANQKFAELMKKQQAVKLHRKKAEADARDRFLVYQASHPSSPSQLTSEEYDRLTGDILWPAALLRDSFSVQRSEVESMVKSRAQTGNTTNLNVGITRKTQQMQQELRKQIRAIRTGEYIEGMRFLNRLALEGQEPVS